MTTFSADWGRRRFLRGALAAGALVVPGSGLLVGCGTGRDGGGGAPEDTVSASGAGAGPAEPSTLSDVLAMVQANESTRAQLEYLNGTAVRALVSPSRLPGGGLGDVALGSPGAAGYAFGEQIGVDAALMRACVVVQHAPVEAGLWFGDYDVARVDEWFAANGGRREESAGVTLWRTAPDYQTCDTTPDGCAGLLEAALNVVRTAPGSFGWSVAHAPLTWLTEPPKEPLAAVPSFAEVAECLGDAVAAIIQHSAGVTYAGGMRVAAVDDVTEVVLARAESAEQATTMLANATRAGREGPLPSDAEITRTGPSGLVVQAAWPVPAGFPVGSFPAMLSVRKFEIFGS